MTADAWRDGAFFVHQQRGGSGTGIQKGSFSAKISRFLDGHDITR
jgi:hypothetical protein